MRGPGAARAEVADLALMADALHRVGQVTVGRNETLEIVLVDTEQIGVLDGADRGGPALRVSEYLNCERQRSPLAR